MLHKKQKALTQTPTSHPAPLTWGEGNMLHKKQKALTKTRPHHLPLSHGERGACFIKNNKALTQTPTSPPAPLTWGEGNMLHKKQKALTQTPTSPPAPLPWGEGSMLHKKQKALTQTHNKPRPNTKRQASPPHEMRPNGRISGGVGGLRPPTKKITPARVARWIAPNLWASVTRGFQVRRYGYAHRDFRARCTHCV